MNKGREVEACGLAPGTVAGAEGGMRDPLGGVWERAGVDGDDVSHDVLPPLLPSPPPTGGQRVPGLVMNVLCARFHLMLTPAEVE